MLQGEANADGFDEVHQVVGDYKFAVRIVFAGQEMRHVKSREFFGR